MKKLIISLLAVSLLIGVVLFLVKNQETSEVQPSPLVGSISPTLSAEQESTQDVGLYQDPNNIFSLQYPSDFTLDTQDPLHVRLFKRGETQRPQSEMSDGALIVLEVIELQDSSLVVWVDSRIAQFTAQGISEIVEAKKSVTLNGYPGFTYTVQGLGSSQNTILQKDRDSSQALLITSAVSDPQQLGYQQEVDAVLATVKFLD